MTDVIKVLNTGKQNEAFADESDFFLSELELSQLLGGHEEPNTQCRRGYKESTWFGGGVRCKCGYSGE